METRMVSSSIYFFIAIITKKGLPACPVGRDSVTNGSKDRRVSKKTQKINVLFGKERFPCKPPLCITRILLSPGNELFLIMSKMPKNNLPV